MPTYSPKITKNAQETPEIAFFCQYPILHVKGAYNVDCTPFRVFGIRRDLFLLKTFKKRLSMFTSSSN